MKTTNNYISTIKEETRQKRNARSLEFYQENKSLSKIKSLLNYYKRKYGFELVQQYIDQYGYTDICINAIKKNTKKTLPKLINLNENI